MIFLVAEIGVNWDGDFNLAREMVVKAKEAGCNAVKFQAFDEKVVAGHPEKSRLMQSSVSENNIETIDSICKSIGTEWFCTPMYPAAVDMLDPYVNRFKIREKDGRPLLKNQSNELIERVMKTDKEVIISSEESPLESIYYNNPKIKWLYCVPKYPCPISDLDFRSLRNFNGFSNHSPEIIAPVTAAILGAEIIEVHITSDKLKEFFDNNVSFDYPQLQEMVKLIRLSEKIKR